MIDLSKYTAKTAAKKLYEGLKKMGFEDAALWSPKKSLGMGLTEAWYVISEDVPFEGLISLSLGGSLYAGEYGYHDSNGDYREPEFKVTGADKYIAEPYNGWNLGFHPDN